VKKKVRKAVALRYDEEKEEAPRLVAKGKNEVAEQIIKLAKLHGIAVREDEDLVQLLSRLELNIEIPQELYQVMAEVLVWVFKMNKQKKKAIEA
jgi:flagellar biosynthesis protein